MNDNEIERRIETAERISKLEERSQQTQTQLNRIEVMLTAHAREEETVLKDILKSLTTTKKELEEQLVSAIKPIKEDLLRLQGAWKLLTIIGGGLLTAGVFFKDILLKFFGL